MTPRPLPWILAMMLCLTASAHATSFAERQLASISRLSIHAKVPRYEPLPGGSPDELQRQLEQRAAAILKHHDIMTDAQAPQELLIEIDYAKRAHGPRATALLVIVEMREMAVLTREPSDLSVFVTSWREARVEVLERGEIDAVLRETLTLILDKFGEAVAMARASASR